ncbi:MAG: hypothetical protein ACWIPI_04030 [Polaribacter sp.]
MEVFRVPNSGDGPGFGWPGGDFGITQAFNNMMGAYDRSSFGQGLNSVANSVVNVASDFIDDLDPSDFIGFFSETLGSMFTSESTGANADCPPGNTNLKCPNNSTSHPNYQGPYSGKTH